MPLSVRPSESKVPTMRLFIPRFGVGLRSGEEGVAVVLPTFFVVTTIATYGLIIRDYLLFIVGVALFWISILGMNWFQKGS